MFFFVSQLFHIPKVEESEMEQDYHSMLDGLRRELAELVEDGSISICFDPSLPDFHEVLEVGGDRLRSHGWYEYVWAHPVGDSPLWTAYIVRAMLYCELDIDKYMKVRKAMMVQI